MESQTSEAAVGKPTIMITDDDRQHSLFDWAEATAKKIWDITDIIDERMTFAKCLQDMIIHKLETFFDMVISYERKDLQTPNHCDEPLNPMDIAKQALDDVIDMKTKYWDVKIKDKDWQDAALFTIGSHMATAMHIERLFYADSYPNDVSAQKYKQLHSGI
jgi:hypothetical protein